MLYSRKNIAQMSQLICSWYLQIKYNFLWKLQIVGTKSCDPDILFGRFVTLEKNLFIIACHASGHDVFMLCKFTHSYDEFGKEMHFYSKCIGVRLSSRQRTHKTPSFLRQIRWGTECMRQTENSENFLFCVSHKLTLLMHLGNYF